MSWKKGKYIGTPPTTRFGHTSTAIGPHLLIFGGWEFTKAQNEIIVLRECSSQLDNQDEEKKSDNSGIKEEAQDDDDPQQEEGEEGGYEGEMPDQE